MAHRILYCENNIDGTVGGSYFSLLYLAKGLSPKEFKPIVVFHHDHWLIPQYRKSDIDTIIWPLPKPFKLPHNTPRSLRPLQSVTNFYRFLIERAIVYARFLCSEKISLVHLNNSVTRGHAWMIAARLCRIPCITHQRGINNHYSTLDRWIGGKADAVICISEAVKKNLIEHNFASERLKVIHNGLDSKDMIVKESPKMLLQCLEIEEGRPIIGLLGNIKEWKGQEVAVHAIAKLKTRFPNLVCLLVGDTAANDRYYEMRIRKLINDLGLENNIIFTGYQSNVADWLNIMDIVIHTSIKPEPFGRVFLEAMSMHKPVIGSDAGAAPEIIKNAITGLLYPPGDAEALASAICHLLKNPEQIIVMGEEGYKRLQQCFHIQENINRTQLIYHKLLH